jgi:hypothetical protein
MKGKVVFEARSGLFRGVFSSFFITPGYVPSALTRFAQL